jgi:hypothetical protein
MINTELISQIRKQCIEALSLELAHGEEVREGFRLELFRFFDLLEQAILAGSAWLDPCFNMDQVWFQPDPMDVIIVLLLSLRKFF